MIRIALPNKGSLSDEAVQLVKDAGYKAKREGRELTVLDSANEVEFLFLRPRDIAVYVASGIVNLGITGRDLLLDSTAKASELLPLGFGKSRFTYAAIGGKDMTLADLNGKRIASSYPNIVKADMASRGAQCSVVKLDGAVEISVRLGVADAIADVVESGATMRQAGLTPIGEPIMFSEAIVIAAEGTDTTLPQIATFLKRIQGILTARTYVMVEYNITEANLATACSIAPGLDSPTISKLSREGWCAVKSMVFKKELNAIIDQLEVAGAKGIIVTDLKTCRL